MVNWPCRIKHKLKWRHTDKTGKPLEGRPLLGPAKISSSLQQPTIIEANCSLSRNGMHPAFINATITVKKDATWSTYVAQVQHIVLTLSDHYVKGKVFPLVVSGAPALQAGSCIICRASP